MKMRSLVTLIAVLALVLAACGGDDSTDTTTTSGGDEATTTSGDTTATTGDMGGEMSDLGLPIIDPIDVDSGATVNIAGSSTVFPLSTAVVAQWVDEGGPEYPIDSIGSGGGFERFCTEGASDISNASRPIHDDEVANCQALGREPIEVRVGTDALSLVVSPGNTFATELTFEELAIAFSLTDAGATWADVNPDFPAHPIALFSPGADSGTFDYFNEEIYPEETEADEPSPILSSIANIVGEDDNVTVQGVAEDGCTEGDLSTTCAIGYFGYAYYAENADTLVAVAIDGGEGPVEPGDDSVNEGTYPLARPLFMYTAASVIAEKPQVAEFMAYYLNNVNDLIGEVGYFPAPTEALQEAADHIKEAAGW
jgi:phosphate transport system substrate-binding protein